MKKLLCIALALVMILPMAFAIPVSAATAQEAAAENWEFRTAGAAGTMNVTDEGYFQIAARDGDAATASSKKAFAFSETSPFTFDVSIPYPHDEILGANEQGAWGNQAFSITLSAGNMTRYWLTGVVPSIHPGNKIEGSFKTIEMKITTEGSGYRVMFFESKATTVPGDATDNISLTPEGIKCDAVAANANVQFSFEIDGDDIKVYVTPEGGEKALIYTIAGAAYAFASTKEVGVAFAASTFGGARTETFTVKAINGTAPAFAGEEFSYGLTTVWNDGNGQPDASCPWNYMAYTALTENGIKLSSHGAWYDAGGVATRTKVDINEAGYKFKINNMCANGYIAISFSTDPLDGPTNQLFWDGMLLPNMDTDHSGDAMLIRIYANGAVAANWHPGECNFDYYDNSTGVVDFEIGEIREVDGQKIVRFYINGQELTVAGGQGQDINITNMVDADNKAYIACTYFENASGNTVDVDILEVCGQNVATFDGINHKAEPIIPVTGDNADWENLPGSGLELGTNYGITEEGYVQFFENVTANNVGLTYTKDLPASYTFSADFFVPASEGGPQPFVAIGASSFGWAGTSAIVYKFQTWPGYYGGPAYAHYGVGAQDLIGASVGQLTEGAWNSVEIIVEDGKATLVLNGAIKASNLDMYANGTEGTGEYIVIGQMFDTYAAGYGPENGPAIFKNVQIITDDGATVYFNTPVEEEPDEPEDPEIPVEYRPTVLGAQYRTVGAPGLRFGTQVNVTKSDAEVEAQNGKVTVNNSTGEATIGNIAKMGTLLIPTDLLGDAELQFTVDGKINGIRYLDIEMKKLHIINDAEGFVTFNVVMIGIPDAEVGGANYDRQFTAVSYIEYANGTIVYSDAISRSIADVAAANA